MDSFSHSFKITIIGLILTSIFGCTHLKEGEVDYARTITSNTLYLNSTGTVCIERATLDEQKQQSKNHDAPRCYETLYPKYSNVRAIKKRDTISLHLSQVFIEDTPEGVSPNEALSEQSSNAEIAILAHVCEQGVKGCSTEFGPKSDDKGRVIYFSDSVKAKQMLNFSYLPIYGPIEYTGKPLIIQLSIIELDVNGEQEKNLIKTLAQVGSKAYAPASNVLSTLDILGRSFLEGEQHDVVFRYSMTLAPEGADKKYSYPVISTGNYVFVKKDRVAGEQEKEIWQDVHFDPLTGRLRIKCEDNDSVEHCNYQNSNGTSIYKDFRENTYLTIQIQAGFTEASLDNQQTLAELMQQLEEKQNKSLTGMEKIFNEANVELTQRSVYKSLAGQLSSVKSKLPNDASQKVKDTYKITSNIYVDKLLSVWHQYLDNDCKNNSGKLPCTSIPNTKQINDLIIETRAVLNLKDSKLDLEAVLPLDKKPDITKKSLSLINSEIKSILSK